MAKHYTLIDAFTPAPKKPCITNWNLCVFCQENTKAALECPARSTKAPVGSGYKSLAEHLIQFQSLGHMPMNIYIERLDDGDSIEATMTRHQACWHKNCRLKFNQTKLNRLGKRFIPEKDEHEGSSKSLGVQTRSSHGMVDLKEATCFFCDEPDGSAGLRNASTYDIDKKVRQCALELEDTALLAKFALVT